jgi:hypothetical protein
MAALRQFLILPLLALAPTAACSDANKQTYAQAALGTLGAITAVGINRAITDDCWARCQPGYVCNEESGLCERGECVPGCEYGSHCVRDARGDFHCESDFGNRPIKSSLSTTQPLDAGVVSDAGLPSHAGTASGGAILADAGMATDGGLTGVAAVASDAGATLADGGPDAAPLP